MKLTEQKLKQIIMEELGHLKEVEPQPAATSPGEAQPPTTPEPESSPEKKSLNMSKLGDEMISVGRAIKSSKIKGLDAKEIQLVSAIMANVLEVAAAGSAGTLLVRINSVIEKNK